MRPRALRAGPRRMGRRRHCGGVQGGAPAQERGQDARDVSAVVEAAVVVALQRQGQLLDVHPLTKSLGHVLSRDRTLLHDHRLQVPMP
eukprot:CAMPEP_0203934864 /NCGR_PEP_ID=MMETSP0359-20131031/72724_1 /ASSEMBLY_ACC=CAM_ASM_000338 /TAXON_ID=268821 /ORGANISM="Scrippsiella Hangoei, Strain SHTV-5" /LENGTH=87 /DNA_ID=CAMNT_0050864625 /DNA_START=243 /DNA_END=502 /DNA_ORIENTATION=+